MPMAIVALGLNGLLGKIVSTLLDPPPSAAGFVHRTCLPAGARPKADGFGTGASNVENAITQCSCLALRQAETCLKSPPTRFPFFTSTLPPRRIAESIRLRTAGLESTSLARACAARTRPASGR